MILKNILTIIALLFSINCSPISKQAALTVNFDSLITGRIVIRGWVYDSSTDSKKIKTLDSCDIKNKTYTYKYKYLTEPMLAYVQIYDRDDSIPKDVLFYNKYVSFRRWYDGNLLLDNANAQIQIHGLINGAYRSDIFNSPETEVKYMLNADMISIFDKSKKAMRQFTNNLDVITNDCIIKNNPKSKYLLSYIFDNRAKCSDFQFLENQINLFSKELQRSKIAIELLNYINKGKRNNISSFFLFSDVLSKKYTYKDFIKDKKYGLIIFWASWCAPCRSEIPQLKELYEKYKDDVSFVSLSIDKNQKEWIDAVKKENLPWLSLSGLPESKTKVSDIFDLNIVPSFIVVDALGKVILNAASGFNTSSGRKKIVTISDIDDFLNTKK